MGVKTAKRILRDNISTDGSLDNNKIVTAMLQYRNTPLPDIELSPAQILFHRQLKDSIPSHSSHYHLHKDWVVAADERELGFAKRNQVVESRYNQHTRALKKLSIGTNVLIQGDTKKWDRQGMVVDKLENRQYRIKIHGSGRTTLRNRLFIKPCSLITPPKQLQNQVDTPVCGQETTADVHDMHMIFCPVAQTIPLASEQSNSEQEDVEEDVLDNSTEDNVEQNKLPPKLPRSLLNLLPHNRPGLRE